MKKLFLTLMLLFAAIAAMAQSTTGIPVDWRYALTWTDPNAPGEVASWIVTATNSPSNVRTTSTRELSIDLITLLNGAPKGSYQLYTVAVSPLGDVSDPGDTIIVTWPGGNGRLKGGKGLGVGK